MGDYGFRISQEGSDVKTCDDIDCVVTSKYTNLKGVLSGTATLTKTTDPQVFTIAHNLGYIPITQVYVVDSAIWYELPYKVFQAFAFRSAFSSYADSSNLYIRIEFYPNADYTFKYFIFLDKGNL